MLPWNYFWILALLFHVSGVNGHEFADAVYKDDHLVTKSLKITLLDTRPPYSGANSPNVPIFNDKYNLSFYDDYEDIQESKLYTARFKQVVQKFIANTIIQNDPKLLTCYYCGIANDANSCIDIKPGHNSSDRTLTCAGPQTWCFTTMLLEDDHPRCVLRGCQPYLHCKTIPLTICCNTKLCNDQNMTNFDDIHRSLLNHWRRKNVKDSLVYKIKIMFSNEASEVAPTAFFFLTVLLILQTVVKVAIT